MKRTKEQKQLRLAIIIVTIIGLISFLSQTFTVFAYGVGEIPYLYLVLYPLLFISLILVIAKSRIGYFLNLISAFSYSLILTNEVGKYLTFEFYNNALLLVLLLPYLIFLSLIPLSISYLTYQKTSRQFFKWTSIFIATGFLIFIFIDRWEKDYSRTVFIDANLRNDGVIELKVKPGFADSREFYVKTDSNELKEVILENGEYVQGTYFLSNTRLKTTYHFDQLKSITLLDLNRNIDLPNLTWSQEEINGDYEFIKP